MKQFIGLKKCVLHLSRVSHNSLITDPVHLWLIFNKRLIYKYINYALTIPLYLYMTIILLS